MANAVLNVGWFSSGKDEAARQLLQVAHQAIKDGTVAVRIVFVFSNRERGESRDSDLFLDLVQSYGLPLVTLSSARFPRGRPDWRLEYDREVMRRLKAFSRDICLLAGYMLIVGEEMCRKCDMVNLHPAAPGGPTGSWQEVIWELIRTRARTSGVIMHLVTPELDRGPVAAYCTYSISGRKFTPAWREIARSPIDEIRHVQGASNLLFRLIRQEGLMREFSLILLTLAALSRGEVRISQGQVVDSKGNPNLTRRVNRAIAAGGTLFPEVSV
ncbi:MAG: formyltransferase family protein [Chloroflexota bacterium]